MDIEVVLMAGHPLKIAFNIGELTGCGSACKCQIRRLLCLKNEIIAAKPKVDYRYLPKTYFKSLDGTGLHIRIPD